MGTGPLSKRVRDTFRALDMGSQDAATTASVLDDLAAGKEYSGTGIQHVAMAAWPHAQRMPDAERRALLDAIAQRSPRMHEWLTQLLAA